MKIPGYYAIGRELLLLLWKGSGILKTRFKPVYGFI